MAEEIQTTEVTKNLVSNQGMLSNISNSLEKIKKFSNEPAVQRSIPVMITLFVIFLGLVFFTTEIIDLKFPNINDSTIQTSHNELLDQVINGLNCFNKSFQTNYKL